MPKKNLVIRAKSYLEYLYFDHLVPAFYPYSAKIRAKLAGENIIHVVGDSHANAFKYQYPFIVHHLGAATAYNLDTLSSTTRSREQLEEVATSIDPSSESVLLVFGEIDCRIHIYNQYRKLHKDVSISTLINKTIESYGSAMARLKSKNIKFYVLSVAPAGSQPNVYNYKYYGSFKQRAIIHKLFNEELQKYCQLHNYPYLDLYKKIVDDRGGVKSAYLLDELHINTKSVDIVKQLILGLHN